MHHTHNCRIREPCCCFSRVELLFSFVCPWMFCFSPAHGYLYPLHGCFLSCSNFREPGVSTSHAVLPRVATPVRWAHKKSPTQPPIFPEGGRTRSVLTISIRDSTWRPFGAEVPGTRMPLRRNVGTYHRVRSLQTQVTNISKWLARVPGATGAERCGGEGGGADAGHGWEGRRCSLKKRRNWANSWWGELHMYIYIYIYTHIHIYIYVYMSCANAWLRVNVGSWKNLKAVRPWTNRKDVRLGGWWVGW